MGNGYLAFDSGARACLLSTFCGTLYWEVDVIGYFNGHAVVEIYVTNYSRSI